MNITIITVGKLKEKYLKQGIAEYTKRLGAYAKSTSSSSPMKKPPKS